MLERIAKKVWLATFLSQVVASLPLIGAGIPDKVVVLTFDDSIKSHHSVVGPLLKRYGFGATFFITEGFDFKTDKEKYMTWEEIASLHKDGFEIGNHTRDHMGVGEDSLSQLPEQVAAINRRCDEYGIPRPTSFAYPGNAIADGAMAALKDLGFTFARRGGAPEHPYEHGKGFAYEPGLDHPLLIPSAGDARPHWTLDNFKEAVAQAVFGKVAVLQFHGVPDRAHAWVHTPKARFEEYMAYLAENDFEVIALRDLHRYVDANITPNNPNEVIEDRKRTMTSGEGRDVLRTPLTEEDKRYWLSNMIEDHGFDQWETRAATGLSIQDIETAVARYSLSRPQSTKESLKLRPYPGGRHPRIAFRDGAMRPQRETKFSVFAPWKDGGYAVVDVPEAIWVKTEESRELLYLAHTHVPTMWSKNKVSLEPLEWTRTGESILTIKRDLPNKTAFGARIELKQGIVQMNLWLRNGTGQTLTGLNVQNCVMLKELEGFAALNNDNKVFKSPYAASRNEGGNRWVITGWERCNRPWANPNCPCLHADPQFPDCAPNDTVELRGVVSFYEGDDIDSEFRRLDSLWRLEDLE
jgi:peptidoglycan/xylan/chitin deacetylase (PgdA/CDA1 family)